MGYLISETTREERERIVAESLGHIEANCDGVVSAADISTLIRYILCAEETVINKSNADINSDEKINVMDLRALKKMLLA